MNHDLAILQLLIIVVGVLGVMCSAMAGSVVLIAINMLILIVNMISFMANVLKD